MTANEDFWNQYDVPFEFGVGQNSRISQLRKGSSGTGRTSSTTIHLYVLQSFEDGRLSRDSGRFLCKGEGQNPQRTDNGQNPEKIDCSRCLSLMERWKRSGGDQ